MVRLKPAGSVDISTAGVAKRVITEVNPELHGRLQVLVDDIEKAYKSWIAQGRPHAAPLAAAGVGGGDSEADRADLAGAGADDGNGAAGPSLTGAGVGGSALRTRRSVPSIRQAAAEPPLDPARIRELNDQNALAVWSREALLAMVNALPGPVLVGRLPRRKTLVKQIKARLAGAIASPLLSLSFQLMF